MGLLNHIKIYFELKKKKKEIVLKTLLKYGGKRLGNYLHDDLYQEN